MSQACSISGCRDEQSGDLCQSLKADAQPLNMLLFIMDSALGPQGALKSVSCGVWCFAHQWLPLVLAAFLAHAIAF
jgi:hypothetical protein